MKDLLISVIIPFYNEELYLERAVNTVLNQSYKPIEIVLINDGSTDNSINIATKICNNNKQCTLITTPNKGPGNARNIGLQNCSGVFVSFLDADDELSTNAIELLINSIDMHQTDLSMGMFLMVDSAQKLLKESIWSEQKLISSKQAISLLINEKLIPTVWGKLFNTSIAKQCLFPIKSWKEDDVFMLQYLQLSTYISIINTSIITLNCRGNSLTRQIISDKMIADISFSYKEQFKIISGDKSLENALVKNKINTFYNLFLILKIDWNQILNKTAVFSLFKKEIHNLYFESKKYTIGSKKRILITFLQSVNYTGKGLPFFMISLLKKNKLIALKAIKS